MKEGETLIWKFPEMDIEFPVRIGKIIKDSYISYHWNDFADNTETFVEINLTETEPGITLIRVTEKSRPNDKTGMEWLKRNTKGWANFLACLKAWMEYGINLRKGAFTISQIPKKNMKVLTVLNFMSLSTICLNSIAAQIFNFAVAEPAPLLRPQHSESYR